jgi:AcrR family transcriptional regulator
MAWVIRLVKVYLSVESRSTVSETAKRLMDLAEAHIRDAGYGGSRFRDLAAEIGIKTASVHHHFPTKATMAAAVARRYGDRFLAAVAWRPNRVPEMPSPFTDWPSGRLSVALG